MSDSIAVNREDRLIETGNGSIAGWLYRPRGAASGVGVVMANGLSLHREHVLPEYAEAFASAGHHVLLFDFRCLGASAGSPRQLVDPRAQRADYLTAARHAAKVPGIERLVLWGYSYSGRHVLELGARYRALAGILAVAPMISLAATTRGQPLGNLMRLSLAGLRDQYRSIRGRSTLTVAAADDEGVSVVRSAGALAGFTSLTADGTWPNELAARFTLRNWPNLWPLRADRILAPSLLAIGQRDSIAPPVVARRAADRMPRGVRAEYPADHFGLLTRADVLTDQLSFLRDIAEPRQDSRGR